MFILYPVTSLKGFIGSNSFLGEHSGSLRVKIISSANRGDFTPLSPACFPCIYFSYCMCGSACLCGSARMCGSAYVPQYECSAQKALRGSQCSSSSTTRDLEIKPKSSGLAASATHKSTSAAYECLSLFVCVHAWMATCAQVDKCMWKPPILSLRMPSTLYFEAGLLVGLELTKCSKLAGRSVPGIYLSLSPCI